MATVKVELTTEQLELISDALDSHWQVSLAANDAEAVEFGNFIDELLEEAEYEDHCEEYDGQPDEAQEWYDFDPDC